MYVFMHKIFFEKFKVFDKKRWLCYITADKSIDKIFLRQRKIAILPNLNIQFSLLSRFLKISIFWFCRIPISLSQSVTKLLILHVL